MATKPTGVQLGLFDPWLDELESMQPEPIAAPPTDSPAALNSQALAFTRGLNNFFGTASWTRYPCLCPHSVLLTEGALYVAEHGGENNGTAYWLLDAIASYQGEQVLKRCAFQVWELIVHSGELAQPADGPRSATLICTNGNTKELVRQEIEYTDFLPIGKIKIYVSIEEHPEVADGHKCMILLLPSEY